MVEPIGRQDTDALPDGPVPAGSSVPDGTGTRREVQPTALVAGVLFILLAVLVMTGVDLPVGWWDHDLGWVLLIGAGVALLLHEWRRARRPH